MMEFAKLRRVGGESRGRIVVVCGASGHPSEVFLILPRPPGVAGGVLESRGRIVVCDA